MIFTIKRSLILFGLECSTDQADALLSVIESNGMLPPKTHTGFKKEDHLMGILTVKVYANVWETENDEK